MRGEPSVGVELGAYRAVEELNPVQTAFRTTFLDKLASGRYWLEDVEACLCGSTSSTRVADHDRFGIPVGVLVCTACGLARTSPRLAAECLPEFYDNEYHGLHMGRPTPDAQTALYKPGQGAAIFGRIGDLLPRTLRVAEVGCGTGQVLREFEAAASAAGHTIEAVGCEYASAYVATGRAAGSDIRAGGPTVLVPDAPFDLVILSHVVEHFADPRADLDNIARLLEVGALAYVEVPGVLTIHRKPQYNFEFSRYFTLAHTYQFSLDALTDVMGASRFALVRGDEEACTVFRRTEEPVVRVPSPDRGPELIRYLNWLKSSPAVGARRLALRTRRSLRFMARTGLGRLLGPRRYQYLRERVRRVRARR